jgi:hypothetical protein
VDRAVEEAEEDEEEGAEEGIIESEDGSVWWRSRRCNDTFEKGSCLPDVGRGYVIKG